MPELSINETQRAISNAMVRIMHESYGKGPARARTYLFDNYVFVLLDDVLTPVERDLKEGGERDLVRQVRLLFEDVMTRAFTQQVEELVDRRVVAYHSQVVFDPDVALEIFVLDPAGGERDGTIDVRRSEAGRPGDVDRLAADEQLPAFERRRGSQGQGPLRAAISNAMTRVLHDFWGKGPTRSKTYLADDNAFCVLEDPLTTVERTLVESGQTAAVRHLRLKHMELRHDVFAREVQALLGREVAACHSQMLFSPDVLIQWFVLTPQGRDQAGAVSPDQADVQAVLDDQDDRDAGNTTRS